MVATHSVLADLTRDVAGDDATVSVLVGPGGDAHTFEPTPASSVALHDATLELENGLGFETWLDKLFAASGSQATRVVVTEGIAPRKMDEPEAGAEAPEHAGHDHGEGSETDPHVWHDVANAETMVGNIAAALIAADPAHADGYATRRDAELARLQELDAWVVEQVALIPSDRRVLATTHDTFGYFARRYGFRVVNLLGSVSTDVADPSAAQIASVIDHIRALKVPAVFSENIGNAKMTERVAQDAGVTVVGSLYTDALGEAGSDGDTYEKMIRFNVNAMVEALR